MNDYLFLTISRIKSILNWRIVRGVAELQILTRATYFMLIFVPILAGLWPAVRLYVNNHNEAVVEATEIMQEHSVSFVKSKDELSVLLSSVEVQSSQVNLVLDDVKEFNNRADDFIADVRQFSNDFMPRTLEEPSLPWTWAAAFFASLFAVFAHLIYQLATPEIVRRFTLDEFVKGQKEDYSKHPSDDALERAQSFLATKEGRSESEIDERRNYRLFKNLHAVLEESKDEKQVMQSIHGLSLSELSGLQSFIQSEGNHLPEVRHRILDYVRQAYVRNSEKVGGSEVEKLKNMSIIERGARAEYLHWASRNTVAAFVTSIIYAIAVIVIFEIISIQANRVVDMAGWNSVFDLFNVKSQL